MQLQSQKFVVHTRPQARTPDIVDNRVHKEGALRPRIVPLRVHERSAHTPAQDLVVEQDAVGEPRCGSRQGRTCCLDYQMAAVVQCTSPFDMIRECPSALASIHTSMVSLDFSGNNIKNGQNPCLVIIMALSMALCLHVKPSFPLSTTLFHVLLIHLLVHSTLPFLFFERDDLIMQDVNWGQQVRKTELIF